jgi:hypothetical protein
MQKQGRLGRALRKTLEYVISGLGFFVAVLTLYPRVTITASGPSDDKNPLSASFTISNDGYLPAVHVSAKCTLAELNLGRPEIPEQGGQQAAMGPGWTAPELSPGEKMGIPLSDCIIVPTEQLNNARVGIIVSYHPYLLSLWERHVTSVLAVKSIGLGHFYWYSSPN